MGEVIGLKEALVAEHEASKLRTQSPEETISINYAVLMTASAEANLSLVEDLLEDVRKSRENS
jgi:hypothetical protein